MTSPLPMPLPGEMHFLHDTDPDFEGEPALCDFTAGLEEAPRAFTLSSALPEEVSCPDCLDLMAGQLPIFERFGADLLVWEELTEDQQWAWWNLQRAMNTPNPNV